MLSSWQQLIPEVVYGNGMKMAREARQLDSLERT